MILKRTTLSILFVWLLGYSLVFSHEGIVVTMNKLQLNGDFVDLHYTIRVNKSNFSKCESLYFNLYLKKIDNTIEFPIVVVQGKLRHNSYLRWLALKGDHQLETMKPLILTADSQDEELLDYAYTIPFEAWMDGATLYLHQIEWGCGENIDESTLELATLQIPQPAFVKENEPTAIPIMHPKQMVQKEGEARIEFFVGQSKIDVDYSKNRQALFKMKKLIEEMHHNPNAKITSVEIKGYASPDGPSSLNQQLSQERIFSVSHYFEIPQDTLHSPYRISVLNMGEDWKGLSQMILESNLPQQEQILRIIDNQSTPDEKEKALKKLEGGSLFKLLKEHYFPELRRAELKISYQLVE